MEKSQRSHRGFLTQTVKSLALYVSDFRQPAFFRLPESLKIVIIHSLIFYWEFIVMFRTQLRILVTISTVALAACSGQPAQNANTNTNPQAVSQESSNNPTTMGNVDLKTKDGRVIIQTSGQFVDTMQNADMLPEGVDKNKIVLSQQDQITGINFYAIHVGSTKNPTDYFNKLKSAIEADKSLHNVNVGVASANRMDYQFSQIDADKNITLNEQCIVLMDGEQIYNVCASSPDSNQKELTAALAYVSTAK